MFILNSRKSFFLLLTGLLISTLFFDENRALAQVGEVPNPDSNGDFKSSFQQGNFGFYKINKWLVVQPMVSSAKDYALNCRYEPNGQIRSRIQRGAIITAVFNGTVNLHRTDAPDPIYDAIVLDSNGSPWLRVKGSQNELAYPAESTSFEQLGQCYVRANLKYIAPINPDSLGSYTKEPKSYCKAQPLYCRPSLPKWLSL